ncbi:hepatic lectin, partial [Patella vulgata]|uniref:hepatic lectin n=1 Tax=Patella vulgata TaxID=6465 RepID=UPI00217FCB4B
CISTEGCTYFYWHNRSCYILNTASPGKHSVNITSIYVDDVLKDKCNLDGYDAIFGGVLCVKKYDTQMIWADAKTTCEQDGGQLLVMRTSVFYIKLEALKSLQPSVDVKHWIGGNDLTTEGEFTWIDDGSDVTTKGWSIGNPDNTNGNEDCLQFMMHLVLNDDNCDFPCFFLCEKPLI